MKNKEVFNNIMEKNLRYTLLTLQEEIGSRLFKKLFSENPKEYDRISDIIVKSMDFEVNGIIDHLSKTNDFNIDRKDLNVKMTNEILKGFKTKINSDMKKSSEVDKRDLDILLKTIDKIKVAKSQKTILMFSDRENVKEQQKPQKEIKI